MLAQVVSQLLTAYPEGKYNFQLQKIITKIYAGIGCCCYLKAWRRVLHRSRVDHIP